MAGKSSGEVIIQNGNVLYYPSVIEDVQWDTERYGVPGKLTFKCMYDSALNIEEGNICMFTWNGTKVFYGFIFTLSITKDKVLSVTAYDQLRYFKNKDTYVITGKKYSEVLKQIVSDFKLNAGTIEDTGYVIPSLTEDSTALFDICQDCADQTLMNNGNIYVLHDNYGHLCLQNCTSMILNLLIDAETGQNFSFSSSIDESAYNKIKLVYDNETTGMRDVYIAQDSSNMNKWGILQFYDKLEEGENGKTKVNQLLKLYNKKSRNLKVENAIGDVRVKAGCTLTVNLNLGIASVASLMLVESCTHTFKENEDWMTLKLRGGGLT